MRHALVLALTLFAGCAAQRPASSTYAVSDDGTVSVGVRSASDATLAPGPQEILGIAIPLPPFLAKAALIWDGMPVVIGPSRQVAPSAACAPQVQTVMVEECYTEMQEVQRTRMVPRRTVTLPVPQRVDPCPEPVSAVAPAQAYVTVAKAK